MSIALDTYLRKLNMLVYVRWLYSGKESNDEDILLEEMDKLWCSLTERERNEVQKLPSRSMIEAKPKKIMQDTKGHSMKHRILVDTPPQYKEAAESEALRRKRHHSG